MTKNATKYFADQIGDQKSFLVTKMRFGDQIDDQIGDQKCDQGRIWWPKLKTPTKFGDQKCDQSMFLVTESIWWPKPVFGDQKKSLVTKLVTKTRFGDQIGDQK